MPPPPPVGVILRPPSSARVKFAMNFKTFGIIFLTLDFVIFVLLIFFSLTSRDSWDHNFCHCYFFPLTRQPLGLLATHQSLGGHFEPPIVQKLHILSETRKRQSIALENSGYHFFTIPKSVFLHQIFYTKYSG